MRPYFFLGGFILLLLYMETSIFRSFKYLVKQPQLINLFKILQVSTIVIPLAWMFGRKYFEPTIVQNNLMIGFVLTTLVTKITYLFFLSVEDIYRGTKFVFDHIMYRKENQTISVEERRSFLTKLSLGIAAIPFTSFVYGILKGRYDFKVYTEDIISADLPSAFQDFKVIQISDIHAGSFDNIEAVQRGLDLIQAQDPDLILFTGDLVNSKAEEIEPFIDMFAKLEAKHGKYSVLGNHDYSLYLRGATKEEKEQNFQQIQKHHENMGFNLLNNKSLLVEKNGATIRLGGVENWGDARFFPQEGDLDKTFQNTLDNEFTILLSHDPTHWEEKVRAFRKKIHLTLSGHTHGMQFGIEIPGFIKWSPAKYRYPRWGGLYHDNDQKLYVNRGFGYLGFPGRVGMSPEISVLSLKKA